MIFSGMTTRIRCTECSFSYSRDYPTSFLYVIFLSLAGMITTRYWVDGAWLKLLVVVINLILPLLSIYAASVLIDLATGAPGKRCPKCAGSLRCANGFFDFGLAPTIDEVAGTILFICLNCLIAYLA